MEGSNEKCGHHQLVDLIEQSQAPIVRGDAMSSTLPCGGTMLAVLAPWWFS